MASNGDGIPRFFTVFLSQYSSESLLIPRSYYEHLPRRLPKTSILMGNGGKFWKVAMLSKQEQVYFGKGWANFVADNELKDGEFLTFVFDGYNRYEVSIYGHGACKEIRAVAEVEEISDGSESDNSEGDTRDSAIQVEEIIDDIESDSEYSPGSLDVTNISADAVEVVNTTATSQMRAAEVVNTTATSLMRGKYTLENPEKYLDDLNNLHFVTSLKNRTYELLVHGQFVKDYQLRFANNVEYIDRFGNLSARATNWGDKRVCIKKWNIICDRNDITKDDSIVCEILRTNNVVHTIKIHLVRGGVAPA
ncbi:B3 domain-containing protein REM21 [Cardamine amara subsp. amara]|uniref:B3 domain-containing protein REM21 n=1 Tax=Cardamine amara subsp. amara TaxID=228776 RepID=A0ABD1AYP8_CARAN